MGNIAIPSSGGGNCIKSVFNKFGSFSITVGNTVQRDYQPAHTAVTTVTTDIDIKNALPDYYTKFTNNSFTHSSGSFQYIQYDSSTGILKCAGRQTLVRNDGINSVYRVAAGEVMARIDSSIVN